MINAFINRNGRGVIRLLALMLFCLLAVLNVAMAHGAEVELASGGQARMKVVVSPQASEQSLAAARELADYLGRISGATFEVTTGDGQTGLAVGTVTDFPALNVASQLNT